MSKKPKPDKARNDCGKCGLSLTGQIKVVLPKTDQQQPCPVLCIDCFDETRPQGEPMTDEALIIINGVVLTRPQSRTVRVALESFSMRLTEEGLGGDEHGKTMTKSYLDAIEEIRKAMYRP